MASREDNGPTGGATHHDDPANAKTKRTLFKKKTRKVSTLLHDKTCSRICRKKSSITGRIKGRVCSVRLDWYDFMHLDW